MTLGIEGISDAVEVGRGGFAIVYRAEQPAFDRTVAVKVLNSVPDETSLQRFQREVRAMGKLSEHPAIATVLDAGATADGRPYLLMPFFSGGSLMDALKTGMTYGAQEAAEIGMSLAGALEAAHAEGILHRDVKPANVMLGRYGDPLLVDFGIARIAGGHETTTGVVTATLSHAAPELLDGHAPSVASDVYALGSTLFTLVAGRPPFSVEGDESVVPLIARIMSTPVPRLPGAAADSGLQAVLERAMAKDPEERHSSAAALGQELERVARGQAPLAPAPPLAGVERPVRALPVDDPAPPVPDLPDGSPDDAPPTTPPAAPETTSDAGETRRFTSDPTAAPASTRTPLLVGGAVVLALVVVGLVVALTGGSDDPADEVAGTEAAQATDAADGGDGGDGGATATPVEAGDALLVGVDSQELALLGVVDSRAEIEPNTVLQIGVEPGQTTALTFEVTEAGRSLRISTAQEADVDPIVGLYRDGVLVSADDDSSGFGNDVLLDLPVVEPGSYEARFAGLTDIAGAVNVALQLVETEPLDGPQQESFEDIHEVDVYAVEVQPGQARGLRVDSTEGLSLRAVGADGAFLDSNSGNGELLMDLTAFGPGTVHVVVGPTADTASYTIEPLTGVDQDVPAVSSAFDGQDLPTPADATREVEATGRQTIDLAVGEVVAMPFPNSDEDGFLHVVARSTDLDAAMLLYDAEGALLAASDDEGGGDSGTDALIDLTLAAGDHTLLLTSFGGDGGGPLEVFFAVVPPRPLEGGQYELDRPDVPQVFELAVRPGDPPPDRIQVQAGRDLQLRLLDEQGGVVDVTDTGGNPPVETAGLPVGEYFLVVTGDRPGPFDLVVG